MSNEWLNKTYWYALPLINISRDKLDRKEFLGSFIGDVDRPDLENKILLWYRFNGSKEFIKFEDWLTSHSNCLGHYEPNKKSTIYIFEPVEAYKEDLKLFQDSKYSRISEAAKKTILKNVLVNNDTDQNNKDYLRAVLYRHGDLRKMMEDTIGVSIDEEAELGERLKLSKEYFSETISNLVLEGMEAYGTED